jgi:hypothetical protein
MFTDKVHPCQGGTASDRMDPVLLAVAEALLAVEHACVDQASPNPHSDHGVSCCGAARPNTMHYPDNASSTSARSKSRTDAAFCLLNTSSECLIN